MYDQKQSANAVERVLERLFFCLIVRNMSCLALMCGYKYSIAFVVITNGWHSLNKACTFHKTFVTKTFQTKHIVLSKQGRSFHELAIMFTCLFCSALHLGLLI